MSASLQWYNFREAVIGVSQDARCHQSTLSHCSVYYLPFQMRVWSWFLCPNGKEGSLLTQSSYAKNCRTGPQNKNPTHKMPFSQTPAERPQDRAPGTPLSFPGRLFTLDFCRGAATRVPPAEHRLLKYITLSISTHTFLSHLSVPASCKVLTVGRHTE